MLGTQTAGKVGTSSRPAWFTLNVLGHQKPHSKMLSQTLKAKQNKTKQNKTKQKKRKKERKEITKINNNISLKKKQN